MSLKELMDFQEEFDGRHIGNFCWNSKVTDDNIELLEFLIISLVGEVGEVANIVKKIVRGDFSLAERDNEIREEIADIFIYLLKISYQMDIDLEEAYFEKMKRNQERFKKYENRTKEATD